jgi:hypothetical protein
MKKLIKPHGAIFNSLKKWGFISEFTEDNCVAFTNKVEVEVGEYFAFNRRVFVLVQEPYKTLPKLFEVVLWVSNMELGLVLGGEAVLIQNGEKKKIKNLEVTY